MDDATTVRLDARALKVLAHPLRSRLLGALRLEGPATATALARALSTNTGATSYHLRRLAEAGLVEETGAGSGRERWWRAAHERHSFLPTDVHDSPDAAAAMTWLQGEYLRQFQERAEAWLAGQSRLPGDWRDAAGSSDYVLDLTPEQLATLEGELDEVIERYRTAPASAAPPGRRRRVFLYLHAFPEIGP